MKKTTYTSYRKIKPTIKYNNRITDITCEDGEYYRKYIDGTTEKIEKKTAVYDIIGAQYYHLSHHGKNPRMKEVAAAPEKIFGDSIDCLTVEETYECIGHLTNGLFNYTNKRCKNVDVSRGIGYMACKLFDAHKTDCDYRVLITFLAFISKGSLNLQFSRKPMGRSLYIGIYNAWPYAKKVHDQFFDPGFTPTSFTGVYDDVLKCTDVFDDPIHNWKKYPENISGYSIDNLILAYCAFNLAVNSNCPMSDTQKECIRKISAIKDCIYNFLVNATPYIKQRTKYELKHEYSGNLGTDIVKICASVETDFKLERNIVPYLDYTTWMFGPYLSPESCQTYPEWQVYSFIKNPRKIDPDCPLMEERIRVLTERDKKRAKRLKRAAIAGVITACLTAIFFFLRWIYYAYGIDKEGPEGMKNFIGLIICIIIGILLDLFVIPESFWWGLAEMGRYSRRSNFFEFGESTGDSFFFWNDPH